MAYHCPWCGTDRRPKRYPVRMTIQYVAMCLVYGFVAVHNRYPWPGLWGKRCSRCGNIHPGQSRRRSQS